MSSYSLRTVRTVDSHTEGNPARVIVGGVPVPPGNTLINRCYQVLFTSQKTTTGDYKQTITVPPGTLDRSPCGTGASARLALLYARSETERNEAFRGSARYLFRRSGRARRRTQWHDLRASTHHRARVHHRVPSVRARSGRPDPGGLPRRTGSERPVGAVTCDRLPRY